MTRRSAGTILLATIMAAGYYASLSPALSYSHQYRTMTNEGASWRFPLGTDDLGRDRLARLLHATGVSLLMATTAALASTALAAALGGTGGYFGGWYDRCLAKSIDLMMALPWLFLLLTARALLPLNASSGESLVTLYVFLAMLGWAAPARVIRAAVRNCYGSEFIVHARAIGCSERMILMRHILPTLRPLLIAQFYISIPMFVLAEANLGILGLSAGEPLPTWGNLLRELASPVSFRPAALATVVMVALSLIGFKLLVADGVEK